MADKEKQTTQGPARRRVRRYLHAQKTQRAMKESILGVSTALNHVDVKRIIECFAVRLNDYLEIDDRRTFRESAVKWVTRIAKLTVFAKLLTHQRTEEAAKVSGVGEGHSRVVADTILRHLDQYRGNDEDFGDFAEWAFAWTTRQSQLVVELNRWIVEHRKAVHTGLWEVLRTCGGLGVGQFAPDGKHPIAEELACDVWLWASQNMEDLFSGNRAPIHIRLRRRAIWVARRWKLYRVREKRRFASIDEASELENTMNMPVDEMVRIDPALDSIRRSGRFSVADEEYEASEIDDTDLDGTSLEEEMAELPLAA